MKKILSLAKIFGPLSGIIVSFALPALLVKMSLQHVPEPLRFVLLFAAIPLGAILGGFWSKGQLGVLLTGVYWIHAGLWSARIIGHYDNLVYGDLNRLGADVGMINLLIAAMAGAVSAILHVYPKISARFKAA